MRLRLLTAATAFVVAACGTFSSTPAPTIPIPSASTPALSPAASPASSATPAPTSAQSPAPATGGPSATATATAAPSATRSATQPPASTRPSVAPTGSPGAALDWEECDIEFECATLRVPLDEINPGTETIEIALVRLPASDPAARIGSLLVNPGGPGASGIDLVQGNADIFSEDVLARFDLIGFDPRGVGASTPISCLDDASLDRLAALDPTPDDAAEREALIAGSREFAQTCQRESGDLLPYMSTEQAARDMEQIRIALGEEQLSFLGFSYGTFLGASYANLYPKRVRAFVLDGAVDPTQGFFSALETQGKGFADALNRFLDDCENSPTCQFNASRNVRTAFDALMESIDRTPLPAKAINDSRPVGPGEAFTGVLYALYDRGSWQILAQALELARRGDGSLLLLLADAYNRRDESGHYENISAANNAVNCADYVVPTDVTAYDALVPKLEAIAPRFGEAIAYSGLTCAFWPVHPSADPAPTVAAGSGPIVVVGTTGDPATPYEWAIKLADTLENGVLLTYEGEGHTAYGGKSSCIDDAIDRYLISLEPPAAGTRCN